MGEVIALTQSPSPPSPKGTKLRFWTTNEIAKATPAEWDWIARPWVAVGAITEVDGKPKAAGKTTWLLHLVKAVVDGAAFMGEPTKKAPVVYLTEQSRKTFASVLAKTGLLGRDDLKVLFWPDAMGAAWDEILAAARLACKEIGAKLLVIDTLPRFAGMVGDSENNAGDALAIMAPLRIMASRRKLGIIVARHERKSGGDVGDAGRGSSAFTGEVDEVLSIRRPDGNQRPTLRVIHAISRDEGEFDRVVELTPAGYVSHGTQRAVAAKEARKAILSVAPMEKKDALTRKELLRKAKVGSTTGWRAIEKLIEKGRLLQTGAGKKNDPYRYWRKR